MYCSSVHRCEHNITQHLFESVSIKLLFILFWFSPNSVTIMPRRVGEMSVIRRRAGPISAVHHACRMGEMSVIRRWAGSISAMHHALQSGGKMSIIRRRTVSCTAVLPAIFPHTVLPPAARQILPTGSAQLDSHHVPQSVGNVCHLTESGVCLYRIWIIR